MHGVAASLHRATVVILSSSCVLFSIVDLAPQVPDERYHFGVSLQPDERYGGGAALLDVQVPQQQPGPFPVRHPRL